MSRCESELAVSKRAARPTPQSTSWLRWLGLIALANPLISVAQTPTIIDSASKFVPGVTWRAKSVLGALT